MNKTPLRAVLWLAVSSKAQAQEDKISLEMQEREGRAWCASAGCEIVAVLRVPGYSRRESDIITALDDFGQQGIYAYHELRELWQKKAFDILVAYTHDRFGRSTTLHSWVVENVILSGAQIYLIADGGYLTANDFRYKIAIGGMLAAGSLDTFIEKSRAGRRNLVARGLTSNGKLPISHTLQRDTVTGKQSGVIVNEAMRPLFNDLARLLIEGVGWRSIGDELYRRFHHADASGKAYSGLVLYQLMHTPTVFGHVASIPRGDRRKQVAHWAYDESLPVPDGVIVTRNAIPSIYEGELRELLIAELQRRRTLKGTSRPHNTYRFVGLVECEECGASCIARNSGGRRMGVQCNTSVRWQTTRLTRACSNKKLVGEKYLHSYISRLLELAISGADLDTLINTRGAEQDRQTLETLEREIASLEQQIDTLIAEQGLAPSAVQPSYRRRIADVSARLSVAQEHQRRAAIQTKTHSSQQQQRTQALDELRGLTLEKFWRKEDRQVNQVLRRVFAGYRLLAREGKIVGIKRV